jgi:peptide/nickel transport system permease protein
MGLAGFLARRLVGALVTVLIVLTAVFLVVHSTSNPAALYLPVTATPQQVAHLNRVLGYDRPLWVQYADYVWHALHGQFGLSLMQGGPALMIVLQRLPNTLYLVLFALACMILVAVPLGILGAVRHGTAVDFLTTAVAVLGQSVPVFWLGMMLVLVFAVDLRLFPTFGIGGFGHIVLPGVTLGAYAAGLVTRLVRTSMLEVLGSDYLRTARAKGLPQASVILKHALRNAALPAVTAIGLQGSYLLGGAIVTEQVFAYPGMGQLVLEAMTARDFNVIQAFVLVVAVLIVLMNLLTDLTYSLIDPRVRYG